MQVTASRQKKSYCSRQTNMYSKGGRRNEGAIILLVLLTIRLLSAIEVFHRVEEHLSVLVRNQTLCLSSNAVRGNHPDHHHRNGYPLDLFGEDVIATDSYSCFLEPVKLHQETHTCSHSHFICPINDEYIPITMNGFEDASTQICDTLNALKDKDSSLPVNLIIVGGSVTWGGYAAGCMEGTCSELKSDGFCTTGYGGECASMQSLVKYLHHRYKKQQLNVVDLSWGATSSCTLSHIMIPRLRDKNITITSRDLLLYDYSVNDGVSFVDAMALEKLKYCMEVTLEKLVHYSSDGFPPTIVLLELYPFKGLDVTMQSPDSGSSYPVAYRKLAKQYHLPIISYRDLYWHPLFRENLRRYPKLEYIVEYKWALPRNEDIHPPWVVHDVYADIISGALEFTHHLCNNKERTDEIVSDPWATFRSTRTNADVVVVLKEEATDAKAPFLTPEEISRLPYGWKLYQDRVGKPGWIIEGSLLKKMWSQRVLTFNVHYQSNSSSTTPTPFSSLATLEVSYMQTYQNAGGFRVQVCGTFLPNYPEQLKVVDTLIREHLTTLDVAIFKVDLNLKTCHSQKDGRFQVKISHEHINDRLDLRGTEKVKITSVRLTVPK
jgi:hypothetical protein